ncbi:MAG TPA: universal stress protein [Pseudonocardiaceae bacterium]|jgi:nucleotide-binding universal stress UspA family protein
MHEAIPVERPQAALASEAIIRPILVGYDGSPPSRHALAYAAGIARRMARMLVLAHVSPTPACYAFDYGWPLPVEDPAELLDWLRSELAETIDPTGLRVTLVGRVGDAARQLAELAEETRADTIVLGAPRHWMHRITGSVPVWLARHTYCPVIMVP